MALLALSHTQVEHRLYESMLSETDLGVRPGAFSARKLMIMTGISAYSTVRRGLAGLVQKLSIEREGDAGDDGWRQSGISYRVFGPEEIFDRRRALGLEPYPKEMHLYEEHRAFGLAIERILRIHALSRREAQVALCCAEGLTNAEIAARLRICEQTIKFHMRHILLKFRVRRRAELISRLLMYESS